MVREMGKAIDVAIWGVICMTPLAIWKLIEIVIWVFKNVKIGIGE